MKLQNINYQFVDLIPDFNQLQEGVLYISIKYSTAVHLCCCGCRNEVITPLSPTDWELTYNGNAVSLNPSIGNWSFPCQSHYWIKYNEVIWYRKWSQKQIQAGRNMEKLDKKEYYSSSKNSGKRWARIKKWLS